MTDTSDIVTAIKELNDTILKLGMAQLKNIYCRKTYGGDHKWIDQKDGGALTGNQECIYCEVIKMGASK